MIKHDPIVHYNRHYVVVQLVFEHVEGKDPADAVKRVESMKLKDELGNLPELKHIIALEK